MRRPSDPARLYTDRVQSYVRFVRAVGYPQGLRAFFVESPILRSGLRVLDAGCGTGIVTLALREAFLRRGLIPQALHAFDLTPAMIERFRRSMQERSIEDITVEQADVLRLEMLPKSWTNYDLVVSASMMEYLPRERLADALAGLRDRLVAGGSLLLFITRENWLMRPLIGRWWDANLYKEEELESVFRQAGFSTVAFRRFPFEFGYLALWGHIVEARR